MLRELNNDGWYREHKDKPAYLEGFSRVHGLGDMAFQSKVQQMREAELERLRDEAGRRLRQAGGRCRDGVQVPAGEVYRPSELSWLTEEERMFLAGT